MKVEAHIGSEVVFVDRFRRVHEGTITKFERGAGGKVTNATIDVPGDFAYGVAWSKVAIKGTPRADGMLKVHQHLVVGTVVRYTLDKTIAGMSAGDYGVVIADKGEMVNVAKLGGHGGHYARLSRGGFAVVPDWQTQILRDHGVEPLSRPA
jgi:hypothetical protein